LALLVRDLAAHGVAQHYVARRAGVGGWSDADFKRAITQGVRKDGSPLKPPMGFRSMPR